MGKKKLFILDDEEDIVRALAARFEASDSLEVAWAYDPDDGLAKIQTFKPDVILLDIILPKMDGWEVCRRLRKEAATKDISLVVMTAIMSKALLNQAFAAKVQVITKPLSEREIAKVIEISQQSGKQTPKPSGPVSA